MVGLVRSSAYKLFSQVRLINITSNVMGMEVEYFNRLFITEFTTTFFKSQLLDITSLMNATTIGP